MKPALDFKIHQLLEEKLIESMLKYGDQIIELTDSENNFYKTTVIEEIINHFEIKDQHIYNLTPELIKNYE